MADGETILRGVGGVRVKRAQRALLGPKVLSALGAGPLWEAPPTIANHEVWLCTGYTAWRDPKQQLQNYKKRYKPRGAWFVAVFLWFVAVFGVVWSGL